MSAAEGPGVKWWEGAWTETEQECTRAPAALAGFGFSSAPSSGPSGVPRAAWLEMPEMSSTHEIRKRVSGRKAAIILAGWRGGGGGAHISTCAYPAATVEPGSVLGKTRVGRRGKCEDEVVRIETGRCPGASGI